MAQQLDSTETKSNPYIEEENGPGHCSSESEEIDITRMEGLTEWLMVYGKK